MPRPAPEKCGYFCRTDRSWSASGTATVPRSSGSVWTVKPGTPSSVAASVSVGLVLPLDNLAREFSGDHNRLMEWFKSLPEVRRWAGAGKSIAYGAKIIRGGGYRELP